MLSLIVGLYVRLLVCVCLSLFVWIFLSLFSYVVTNCTCIGTSLDPRFSLSLSLSVSVSEYIIGTFHVCEEARPARPVCNSAIENSFFFVFNFCVYTYVSWFVFLSFSFALNVCTSFRMYFDTHFFLSICFWMCVAVSEYIIPHYRCKCTSLDACFSLSFAVNVLILFRVYCH